LIHTQLYCKSNM